MQSEINVPRVSGAKVVLYLHRLLILQHFWQLHAGSDVRCAAVRVGADDFHPSHTHGRFKRADNLRTAEQNIPGTPLRTG